MTAMLASVRSLTEAQVVAACGADWIDLKEPTQGALGAVDAAVIREVAAALGERFRISATIGDCWDTPSLIPARVADVAAAGAAYVKIGVYAAAPSGDLLAAIALACAVPAQVIVVCFAEAPPGAAALTRLAATGIAGVMLDTAVKRGPSLRTLMSDAHLQVFVDEARRLGLLTGLAGRLAADDIAPLLAHRPDYLGFRSALCDAAERNGHIDRQRVLEVRARIGGGARPAGGEQGSPRGDHHGLARENI